MPLDVVGKDLRALSTRPHLVDYAQTLAGFSWQSIREDLEGLPGNAGLNIAHEAVDRHANGARALHPALRCLGKDGSVRDLTYADLARASSRFARVLEDLGLARADRVASLLGRVPELYVAALGTLKHGGVFCPLFSQFGPEPIAQRLSRGDVRVLVTTAALYNKKVAALRDRLPQLQHVLLVDAETDLDTHVRALSPLMAAAADTFTIPPTSPDDMALLHFTSGTTGLPKGAVHVHEAVLMHYATGRYALDLHPDDVYWCTADPGWVTGTSYGIVAPLLHGVTSLVDEADFDAERWYRHAPGSAGQRLVHRADRDPPADEAGPAVRRALRPERPAAHRQRRRAAQPGGGRVGQEALGLPIHDNWWQTETGGIMIANFAALDIRPGSMGRPLPGVEVAIVHRTRRRRGGHRASPASRANSRSGPAGRRCSAATCTTRTATPSASSAAGT